MPVKRIRREYQAGISWLKRVVSQPQSELDRWQRLVRAGYEVSIYGARALRRDRAPEMAAALSFRTLFALLPVIVVSTVVVKAVGGVDQFQKLVTQILDAMGAKGISFTPPGSTETVLFVTWMERLVGEAASIDLSALGWIGLAVVIYSAIGLMVTIENSFNTICRAPEGRPWVLRVLVYWAVLTLGPIFIGIAFYIDTRFSDVIANLTSFKWLVAIVRVLWGLSVSTIFMFLVYRLIPNTRVKSRPALIGALVAAIFLQIGKVSLGTYFAKAFSIQSLYASLGMIPLLMFWVYLMWLVVLFGLEVAALLQHVRGQALETLNKVQPATDFVDPAAVIALMEVVAGDFEKGKPTTVGELSAALAIPEASLSQIVDRLIRENLLHRVENDSAVTLARPPQQIGAEKLLDVGYSLVDEGAGSGVLVRSVLLGRLRAAQKALAAKASLGSIAGASAGAGGGGEGG